MISKIDLLTLDYTYNGMPFCLVPSSSQDLMSLDYSYDGQPWIGAVGTEPAPGPTLATIIAASSFFLF